MSLTPRHILISLPTVTLGLLAAFGVVGAVPALAGEPHPEPHWNVLTRAAPTNLPPGGTGQIVAVVMNLGDAPVLATLGSPVTITDVLPEGVEATGPMQGYATRGNNEGNVPQEPLKECSSLSAKELTCKYVGRLDPFIAMEVFVPVHARTGVAESESNTIKVEGANAAPKIETRPVTISSAPTSFGVERFELLPEAENGSPDVRAGAHPFQLTTTIELNQTLEKDPATKTNEDFPSTPELTRNLTTTLPPGLVADARASVFPQCSAVQFAVLRLGNSNECPASTAIGAAVVTFKERLHFARYTSAVPVFNLVPEPGEPARFGFVFEKVPVILDTSLKTGHGYAVEVKVQNASQAAELLSSVVTVWGIPGEATHRSARGWECLGGGYYVSGLEPRPTCPENTPEPQPYLIMPTTCAAPFEGSAAVQPWERPSFEPPIPLSEPVTLQGCGELPFSPSIEALPDQHEVSKPSGLNVEVTVPQGTTLAAEGRAEADVESTTVALPEGMVSNAGAADGLSTCGTGAAGFTPNGSSLEEQLGEQLFTPAAIDCPSASKVGTVSIQTPLLENELNGDVYFASQNTNPFASPLVLYMTAEDKETGVRVKLAGEVKLNQATGQLVSAFRNTPPVPFEKLKLHLTDGPRATQSTPSFCRSYTTSASFEPSSGTPTQAVQSGSFSLAPNADGEPCPSQGPLALNTGFEAGSTVTKGGEYTPFTLTIRRPDGDQPLKSITVKMPPGLAAKLASVTPCPEPGAASGDCGPESEIGHSTAVSGLGSDPVSLPGNVYLTVGYGGAPFGIVDVTDATAGPFHLGNVVVRSKIEVDPFTAAVTVTSDALPQFVKGVPSQIKVLNVTVDRPQFEFNPTNCSTMAVNGTIGGYEGGSQSTSSSFHATECSSLPFTPQLSSSADGQGSKANGVGFNVTINSAGIGQAGIQKVFLTIPRILPSRLTTIQKACVDAVFERNPAECDEGSLIGSATIHTPVFKNPLSGPAYLVSHGNAAFPDVEFVLQGEGIKIVLDGKTDIKKGVTYSRFESSPDAPFTSFETSLPAGPHSALTVNNEEATNYSICGKKVTLPTEITGQNGAVIKQSTSVVVSGCGGVKAFTESRSQKLAKALKKCRAQFKHSKAKRQKCEKAARKKYGAKRKPSKKKTKK